MDDVFCSLTGGVRKSHGSRRGGTHASGVERDRQRGVDGQQQLAVAFTPVFNHCDIGGTRCRGDLENKHIWSDIHQNCTCQAISLKNIGIDLVTACKVCFNVWIRVYRLMNCNPINNPRLGWRGIDANHASSSIRSSV